MLAVTKEGLAAIPLVPLLTVSHHPPLAPGSEEKYP